MHKYGLIFFLLALFSTAVFAELSDPTRPTIGDGISDSSDGKLHLNALMRSGNETVAIINGSVLRLHDVIASYEVAQINGDIITLKSKKDGTLLQLTMSTPDVKTPV